MPGPGTIVNPNAILTYGQNVGSQAGTLQRINSVLVGARVPADGFGKLPEAGELYQAYMQHANEVLDITAKLPNQITQVADSLFSTAKYYQTLEQGLTEGICTAFSPVDFGGGAYKGGSPGNTTGTVIKGAGTITSYSMKAWEWVNESEAQLPAFAVDNIYGASSGMEGLIDEGINWVLNNIPELPHLLDQVTGDTAALKAAASTWHDMAVQLNGVVRELKADATSLPKAWAGEAAMSFGDFMGDVVRALGVIAQVMGQTQQILEEAASEAEFAHDTIVMIFREVVEWVAGNLLADAVTFGLAAAASAPATELFLVNKLREAEQAASKLAKVYETLLSLVRDLKKLKEGYKAVKGLSRLKRFYSMSKDFENAALDMAKLKNLRAFGKDVKLGKIASKLWDADELKKVSDMGKTEFFTRMGVKATLAGGMAFSGLSAGAAMKDLGKDYLEGVAEVLGEDGQGGVDLAGLGPSIPDAPPESQIEDMTKPPEPPKEP